MAVTSTFVVFSNSEASPRDEGSVLQKTATTPAKTAGEIRKAKKPTFNPRKESLRIVRAQPAFPGDPRYKANSQHSSSPGRGFRNSRYGEVVYCEPIFRTGPWQFRIDPANPKG